MAQMHLDACAEVRGRERLVAGRLSDIDRLDQAQHLSDCSNESVVRQEIGGNA
jgi:hypothetical protein